MTAKQKAAKAKFKQVVAEAGKLRKKNPKLTQAQAVKQAWAIEYSKAKKGKKIAEIGKIKKSAPKKSAPKKNKVIASKRKLSEMHTDTKSHNVNIRVVSGINHVDSLEKAIKRKEELERILSFHKKIPVKQRDETSKVFIKKLPNLIKNEKQLISQLKKMIK